MGLLTSRIQFLGLHSQVIPGSDFSVYFFLIVNIPLLVYLEEVALVAGPADEVSARGREIQGFLLLFAEFTCLVRQTRVCSLHPPPSSSHCPLHPTTQRGPGKRGGPFDLSDVISDVRVVPETPSAVLSELRQVAL